MRTVIFTEDETGLSAVDTDGQYVHARRNDHNITYTSFLMDDPKPVQHTSAYQENWRSQVASLMGF